MNTAYLALGSNLGERRDHLAGALTQLQATGVVEITRLSSVYETAPVGIRDQPDFFNLVTEVRTTLSPEALLERCLQVEANLGRVRRERWGPRTIDLDVLWFNGISLSSSSLTLPHPRMIERAFVLAPLAEIAPHLEIDGETVGARAARLGREGLICLGPLLRGPALSANS